MAKSDIATSGRARAKTWTFRVANAFIVFGVTAFVASAAWPWAVLGVYLGVIGAERLLFRPYLLHPEAAHPPWREAALAASFFVSQSIFVFPVYVIWPFPGREYAMVCVCLVVASSLNQAYLLRTTPRLLAAACAPYLIAFFVINLDIWMGDADEFMKAVLVVSSLLMILHSVALIQDARASHQAALDARDDALAQRARAERAAEAKSQFLAIMSHELRTPLNAIIGYAELVLEAPPQRLEPEARTDVDRIRAAALRLKRMVDDVLDLARLDDGGLHIASGPVDLAALVQAVAEKAEPEARANGNRLVTAAAAPASPVIVRTDPARVRQAFEHLVANACKFTHRGVITLGVRADQRAGRDQFRLYVTDTGPGLTAAECRAVFEPFNQLDDSSTRPHDGAGLGLTVAQGLAQALGGRVDVASVKDGGSTFSLVLPSDAPTAPTEVIAPPNPETASADRATAPL
ncbi:MAG: sensor histidine kinase [Maricaulaceae bacterium]